MTKPSGNIAQKIIGGVFALAVIYFIAGIVVDKNTGPRKAQERFDAFAYEVRTLAAKYEPTSEAFKAAFAPLLAERINDFDALYLYVNNQLLFNYSAPLANEGAAATRVSENTKTLFGNNLEISGILRTTGTQTLVAHAKVSFVLILLGTSVAIVLLLLTPQSTKKRRDNTDGGYKERASEDDDGHFDKTTDETISFSKTTTNNMLPEAERVQDNDDEITSIPQNNDEQPQHQESISPETLSEDTGFPQNEDTQATLRPADEESSAQHTADNTSNLPQKADDQTEETGSFILPTAESNGSIAFNRMHGEDIDFDPIGEMEEDNRLSAEEPHLGTQDDYATPAPFTATETAYEPDAMTVALENELVDAIASGQDISALIIQLRGLTPDSTSVTQLKKLLTDRLGRQGIVGDHDGAIALIVKNTALDTALAFAQSLNNAISVILQRSGQTAQTAIGISARSFRMINAKQLLTEAQQAALHADNENPIIAFRADPEKYKQFLQEV